MNRDLAGFRGDQREDSDAAAFASRHFSRFDKLYEAARTPFGDGMYLHGTHMYLGQPEVPCIRLIWHLKPIDFAKVVCGRDVAPGGVFASHVNAAHLLEHCCFSSLCPPVRICRNRRYLIPNPLLC